ncbi:MAG: hypothetical protein VX527_00005, partial [Planctomycetota bacterium]|nr:hypothetical protein [Planctomycetota bacterium]
ELRALDRLTVTPPSVRTVGDNLILGETDDVGQVGSGLLIAFFLFVIYWLVAVPLCWATLKKRRWLHFSWLGFFLSTLLFTVIAWVTVVLTRESSIQIRHLTVIDSVHGQDQQQGVSWMSLFTPGYGNYELIIEGDGKDLLLPWEPSETRISGFPDTRQTTVDTAIASNRMIIPSRSTTTPLQLDWRGPIAAADWGDVLRMDPERPVHVVRNREGQAVGLRGSIVSRLPGTLEDVQVLFVDRAHPLPRQPEVSDEGKMSWVKPTQSGRMEREGWLWAMVNDVPEDSPIMLDNLVLDKEANDLEKSLRVRYSLLQDDLGTPMKPFGPSGRRRALEALTVYHQLEPPQWIRGVEERRDRIHAITTRLVGRELDLSAWMAQPAVIVMGFLPASELPIPLLINGEAPTDSEGLVMVRWILPLQENTPRAGSTTTGG